MLLAALILILSTGLVSYCFLTVCQKLMGRRFPHQFSRSIAKANWLEFPSVRKALDESGVPRDYRRLRLVLECDFLALTYLLKNGPESNQSYSYEERLLIIYFKLVSVSLDLRHWLRLPEKAAVLKLTDILQYFADVVGEH